MDKSDKKNNNIENKSQKKSKTETKESKTKEIGGAKGPEPTRYGDWAHKGRTSDF
jgi:hypothetical protein